MNDLFLNLTTLGFGEYEARVYLALLSEHPATGYQLSKSTGVPRSMIYEALGRLDARGAVLKTTSQRATLFRPVPPATLLDRHEQEHSARLKELRGALGALYLAQPTDLCWSISGHAATLSYAAQLVEQAQHTLWLVLNDSDLGALRPAIEGAAQRGVAIHALLTGAGVLVAGQVTRHPERESVAQQMTEMLVVLADDKECLISGSGEAGSATVTTNPHLALIARQFIWMEIFTQRIRSRLGPEQLALLDPEDRALFETPA